MSSLRKNYLLSLINQTLTVISPLIVTPFVARKLLADNIGIFSFTESIVFMFGLFALHGSQAYGQREIAYCLKERKKELQIFAEVFVSSTITTAIVLAGYVFFILKQSQHQLIYWIQILELIAFHWDIEWFYIGKEDFKTLLFRNMLVKSLYVILIFSLIRDPGDLPLYVLLRVGTFLLGTMFLLFPVIAQCISARIKIHWQDIPHHLKRMIPLFIPQIAIQVYSVMDKTMIGVITHSPYQNGCYEEAMKVIRVMMNFVGAAGGVLMPRIASLHAEGNAEEIGKKMLTGIRFVTLITLPMIVGISIVAPIFIQWFLGDGFFDTVILLQVLAVLLLIIGFGRIFGSCLLAVKKENPYTRNVCIGAAVNFALNLWLIHNFQAKGAAIASVAAEIIVTSLMIFECRKYLDFGKFFKTVQVYPVCAAVMLGVLLVIKNNMAGGALLQLVVLAISGMAVYGIGLLICKDELSLSVLKAFQEKLAKKL